ncbi:MAG: hypothetical protein ACREML_01060 [Vulcanimicrobiaceae bacterium]
MSLTQGTKHFLEEHGCDLVGVAPIERFPVDKTRRDPRIHYPRTRNVVTFAMRVPFASATPFPSVGALQFGDFNIEHQLNEAAYLLCRWLEDQGHICAPMPAGRDVVGFEVHARGPEPKIEMTGSFDLRYAAVMCGLGEIGANGLLISEEFGSRVRLCAVLTTAPLEPDEAKPWGDVPPEFCRQCGFRCVKACPAGAIGEHGRVDHYRCLVIRPDQTDAAIALPRLERELGGKPLVIAAKQLSYAVAPPHTCSTCTTLCPMDKGRRLSPDPFIREGWRDEDFDAAAPRFS